MRRPAETPPQALRGDEAPETDSKTRRKAEVSALQTLGEALLNVSPARRAELELPERLIEALDAALRITRREARRRQLQFIGRLMRDIDAASIRKRLSQWADAHHVDKARL